MLNLSKAQEREERQGLGRGLVTSVFGLVFCWVPLVGLLLSGIGFGKIVSRVTARHKGRRVAYILVSLLILIVSAAVLMGEVYAYVQNPNILHDAGGRLYTWITGEEMPATDTDEVDAYMADGSGVDYDVTGAEGMGLDTSIYGYEGDDVWSYDESEDYSESDEYDMEEGG